jgi:hypothetical protein
MATSTTRAPLTLQSLRGKPARRRKEALVRGLLLTAAVLSILISL